MNYHHTIEPFISTDNPILKDFIVHTLHDYPSKKQDWIRKLLLEVKESPEMAEENLLYLKIDPSDEEMAGMVIEEMNQAPTNIRYLYERLLVSLQPDIVLKYRDQLTGVFQEEELSFYEFLESGEKEDIWREYLETLHMLKQDSDINFPLYQRLRKLAYALLQKGAFSEEVLLNVFYMNLQEDWFDYDGLIAVYLMKLMKYDKHVDLLASLLVRDDDALLDEVAETLISFQTDEVVDAVKPYLFHEESFIFAASIIENIKTEAAVDALRDAYHRIEDEGIQGVIFEALVHQLSPKAEPEINEYSSKADSTILIDVAQLAYSYYKILGMNHPKLEEWKEEIEQRGYQGEEN